MTPWLLAQCLYVLVGGQIAPLLIGWLFGRDRALGALADALPAFVIVIGVLLLWPMLVLLIAVQEP